MMNQQPSDHEATIAVACDVAAIAVGLVVAPIAVVAWAAYRIASALHELGSRTIQFIHRFVNAG